MLLLLWVATGRVAPCCVLLLLGLCVAVCTWRWRMAGWPCGLVLLVILGVNCAHLQLTDSAAHSMPINKHLQQTFANAEASAVNNSARIA
jgi:hypothetical protein